MRVLVVGACVIGLTCAVRLAEAEHEVHVLARDLPLETTSAVAAAWWYPYRAAPQDRVNRWSQISYEMFAGLADVLDCVQMRTSHEVTRAPAPRPWWADTVPSLEAETRVPPGYAAGWVFQSPVIEMGRYLPYLVRRLAAAGGSVTRMALSALPAGADLVVNAAGLANRALVGDGDLHPVRGQVVLMGQCGLEDVWLDAEAPGGPVYVVPRTDDIVLGGTDQHDDWRRDPDPATARTIIERAVTLVPELRGARVLGHQVGLRPARPTVRLELQRRDAMSPVIHCYGHGGAGVTVSWGCAEEVAALAGSLT